MRILIVEDTVNDLLYYNPLFNEHRDISFLFFSHEKDFTKEKLENLAELVSEDLFRKVKKFHVCDENSIQEFLASHTFDFYILDSLKGYAKHIAENAPCTKENTAFFTSTSVFKDEMKKEGYRAYKKTEIEILVDECLSA